MRKCLGSFFLIVFRLSNSLAAKQYFLFYNVFYAIIKTSFLESLERKYLLFMNKFYIFSSERNTCELPPDLAEHPRGGGGPDPGGHRDYGNCGLRHQPHHAGPECEEKWRARLLREESWAAVECIILKNAVVFTGVYLIYLYLNLHRI